MAETQLANNDITLAQAMFTFLNKWEGKPVNISLDELLDEEESMMLQPLASSQITRKYVNGSYIGQFPFAVYYRIKNSDTSDRINARKTLEKLSEWFRTKNENGMFANLPDLGEKNTPTEIASTSAPSMAASYDNGVEDYQAIFNLSYYHKEV